MNPASRWQRMVLGTASGLAALALGAPAAPAAPADPAPASRRPANVSTPAGVPAPADRGWIGVSLGRDPLPVRSSEEGSEAGADEAGPAPPAGVGIGAVIRQSPADRAGLRGGDLVTAIDGQPVESTQEFIAAISGRGPGAWVDLDLWRRGSERRVTVRLERFPEDAARLRDVKLGWAGIEALDVPLQLREQWGGSEESGVLVGAVAEGGPAERSGVRPGDLVLAVDGEPVVTVPDLFMRIARVGDGAKVELGLSRQGLELTVEILLEVEPPEDPDEAPPRRNPAEGPTRRPNGR
ncbi:MAG: PDZ domain-containing protein [Acidobacteria bacterium]|nr:PDZ domain-containing protein [Acidobacteriota bacterium]